MIKRSCQIKQNYREACMDNKQRALEINTILAGKYIVLDVLGEGGFGITYLGLDTTLERKIAIKEYFPTVFVYGESRSTRKRESFMGTER